MIIQDVSAIVSGGVSGLGEATTRRLVAGGARVVMMDLNEEKGKAMEDELGVPIFERLARGVHGVACDSPAHAVAESVPLAECARAVAGADAGAAVDLAVLAAALLAELAEVVPCADARSEQPLARRVVLARAAAVEVADEQGDKRARRAEGDHDPRLLLELPPPRLSRLLDRQRHLERLGRVEEGGRVHLVRVRRRDA